MNKLLLFVACGLLIASGVIAAVPTQMNVQGRLLNAGSPMAGSHPATFRIYEAATGGTTLWTESSSLTVQGGIFSAILGQTTPIPPIVFGSASRWLEVTVDGSTLAPRLQLTTSAYAFWSQRADTANVALSGAGSNELWSTDGTNVWRASGKVGVGLAEPVTTVDIQGTAHIANEVGIGADAIGGVPLRVGGFVRVDGGPAGSVRMMSNGSNGILETLDNSGLLLQPSGGNVGIGTLAPNHPLEAHSTTPGQVGYFHSTSTSGTNYGLDAGAQGVGAETNIGAYLYASGAASNHAIIVPDGYGNVGIGTTSPQSAHRLEVRTTYTGKAAFLRSDATYGDNIGVDAEAFGSGAATNIGGWFAASGAANNYALIVPPGNGDVGIGTITPNAKLHVIGDALINGALTVSGTKCRTVEGTKFGTLYYNAVESGEAIFTTSGRAKLENGKCHVELSPKWLAGVTIDDQHPLDVTTVTFYGPHGDWYVVPGTTGFDLVDPSRSTASFFWAVQARQKGYQDLYLDRPETVAKR